MPGRNQVVETAAGQLAVAGKVDRRRRELGKVQAGGPELSLAAMARVAGNEAPEARAAKAAGLVVFAEAMVARRIFSRC